MQRLNRWVLASAAIAVVIAGLIVAFRPAHGTGDRQRRQTASEEARRTQLAHTEVPPVPESLLRDPDPNLQRAISDYAGARYAAASAKLHDAAVKDPANAEIEMLLGACYLMSNDAQAAIRELKIAIALAPDRSDEARLALAKAYVAIGSAADARNQLERIIENRGRLASEAARQLSGLRTPR